MLSVVYFMQIQPGPIKIGFTNDVPLRWGAIQLANPYLVQVLGLQKGGAREEHALHIKFASVCIRGEWHEPTEDLLQYIAEHSASAQDFYKSHLGADYPVFRVGWPDFFRNCVPRGRNLEGDDQRRYQLARVTKYRVNNPERKRVSVAQCVQLLNVDHCHVARLIDNYTLRVVRTGEGFVALDDIIAVLEAVPIGALKSSTAGRIARMR